ncbi:hypothetical protein EJC51_47255 [Streptomyces aquilus]|uniref:Uncharacterized protein n=1 Tax=Streptomyces aquilus TaxID=2548456 RepID=A0A3S9IF59_9ACTN|nr:hypothetical protein [Streptomyces aquilus]AZP14745.1 hypothetical protein EJC51_00290 [Streptomyces aquilus]AZP22959.1 hypothetical protein EJC51_47255 [Streptomyces aquilus]
MVAASAADADSWVASRVDDGDELRKELAPLVEELQKHDVVGNSLQAVRKWVAEQMLSLGSAAVLHTTWPWWVGAAGAGMTALLTVTAEAGQATGSIFIPLVLGVLGMGGGVAVLALRGTAHAASRGGQQMSKVTDYLFHRAGSIGAEPERLFEEQVRPALAALFEKHGRADAALAGPAPVVPRLRNMAETSLVLAIGLLVVSAIVFAVGFGDAWHKNTCVPSAVQYCP